MMIFALCILRFHGQIDIFGLDVVQLGTQLDVLLLYTGTGQLDALFAGVSMIL